MGHERAGPSLTVYLPPESALVIDWAIEGFSATMTTLQGLLTASVLLPAA